MTAKSGSPSFLFPPFPNPKITLSNFPKGREPHFSKLILATCALLHLFISCLFAFSPAIPPHLSLSLSLSPSLLPSRITATAQHNHGPQMPAKDEGRSARGHREARQSHHRQEVQALVERNRHAHAAKGFLGAPVRPSRDL